MRCSFIVTSNQLDALPPELLRRFSLVTMFFDIFSYAQLDVEVLWKFLPKVHFERLASLRVLIYNGIEQERRYRVQPGGVFRETTAVK